MVSNVTFSIYLPWRQMDVTLFIFMAMQFLQMKVTRLEHLVNIKDMKIAELKRQLELNDMARHTQLHLYQHPIHRRR